MTELPISNSCGKGTRYSFVVNHVDAELDIYENGKHTLRCRETLYSSSNIDGIINQLQKEIDDNYLTIEEIEACDDSMIGRYQINGLTLKNEYFEKLIKVLLTKYSSSNIDGIVNQLLKEIDDNFLEIEEIESCDDSMISRFQINGLTLKNEYFEELIKVLLTNFGD